MLKNQNIKITINNIQNKILNEDEDHDIKILAQELKKENDIKYNSQTYLSNNNFLKQLEKINKEMENKLKKEKENNE